MSLLPASAVVTLTAIRDPRLRTGGVKVSQCAKTSAIFVLFFSQDAATYQADSLHSVPSMPSFHRKKFPVQRSAPLWS